MRLRNVRFHNGGYCWQLQYLAGVRSLWPRKFYAVFVSFEHPQHGICLIDTGYGPDIFQQTKRLPWRVMRWATPIPRRQPFTSPEYLNNQGIAVDEVQRVFVSHYHADHIGAARLFPDSRFVFRRESYDELKTQSSWQQLDHGFLPGLLPDDFVDRSLPIDEVQFELNEARFPCFRSFDYWGDGSLVLVDLPGHAVGHTGYLMQTDAGPRLYVVDAYWDRRAFDQQRSLPWLSRRILHDHDQYCRTIESLQTACRNLQVEPLACHCPQTQTQVWDR